MGKQYAWLLAVALITLLPLSYVAQKIWPGASHRRYPAAQGVAVQRDPSQGGAVHRDPSRGNTNWLALSSVALSVAAGLGWLVGQVVGEPQPFAFAGLACGAVVMAGLLFKDQRDKDGRSRGA